MRTLFLLTATLIITAACNNSNNSITQADTITSDSKPVSVPPGTIPDSSLQGCYSLINGRDTASLELSIDKNNVSGSLSYNIFQKDRNDGSFQGEMSGNLLKIWYLFRSEGVMSVRQEILKIEPGKLIPATGEIIMRGDTAMFSNPSGVTFDNKRAFVKVNCVI